MLWVLDLKECITSKKQALIKKHLKVRLRWLKNYDLYDGEVGITIIFSNENRMKLSSNKRKLVWNFPRIWKDLRYTTKTVEFESKFLMHKNDDSIKLVKLTITLIVLNEFSCCKTIWKQAWIKGIFFNVVKRHARDRVQCNRIWLIKV